MPSPSLSVVPPQPHLSALAFSPILSLLPIVLYPESFIHLELWHESWDKVNIWVMEDNSFPFSTSQFVQMNLRGRKILSLEI